MGNIVLVKGVSATGMVPYHRQLCRLAQILRRHDMAGVGCIQRFLALGGTRHATWLNR